KKRHSVKALRVAPRCAVKNTDAYERWADRYAQARHSTSMRCRARVAVSGCRGVASYWCMRRRKRGLGGQMSKWSAWKKRTFIASRAPGPCAPNEEGD